MLVTWTSNEDLSTEERRRYRQWLESDRSTLPPHDGYLFHFLGELEQRAFVDGHDPRPIAAEIARLQALHAPEAGEARSRDFQRAASQFVCFLLAQRPEAFTEADVRRLADAVYAWNKPALRAALAWHVVAEKPLPAWLAMTAAGQSPASVNSAVRRRVPEQFERLFAERYARACGAGVALKVSKRSARHTYRPVNVALDAQSCSLPNPLGIRSQFVPLAEIWNECVKDLRRLSSLSSGKAPTTVEAWEALPPDLRRGTLHPLTRPVVDLVGAHIDDRYACLVPVRALADAMQIPPRDRYTPTQSRRIAETAELVGYGIEPDVRLMGGAYRADQRLSTFLWVYDQQPSEGQYPAAAVMMRFGMAVTEATGNVTRTKLDLLADELSRVFDLSEHDVRRLEALEDLLLEEGADPGAVGRRLQDRLDKAHRLVIGRLLIALAASDGTIYSAERKILARCYRLLGLEKHELADELSGIWRGLPGDASGRVSAAVARADEAPAKTADEEDLTVDPESVRSVLSASEEEAVALAHAIETALREATVDAPVGDVGTRLAAQTPETETGEA